MGMSFRRWATGQGDQVGFLTTSHLNLFDHLFLDNH